MQKNVASQKIGCQMVSASDGSAFTSAVTVYVTGDAGTQAVGSVGAGACTHEGNGYHTYAPAQAETNYDLIAFTFIGTGAVPSTVQIYTRHDANVTHWIGTAPLALSSQQVQAVVPVTQKVDIETIKTNPVVNAGTVTFPTTATLASTTNITAATGIVLSGVTHTGAVIPTVTTTTTATNLTNERAKYMHGAVWIGPTANTNTVNYTDGIMTNPVSTVAAAKTIADSLGLKRFWVQAGVTITLGADMAGYFFTGKGWTLTTSGSRAFTGTVAEGAISVTGTFTSTGASPYWMDCEFGATCSVPPSNFNHCEFGGTTTFNAAGNYDLIDCASVVAGTSTPVFAVPAGTVNISFRRWSGGISITGITSGTTISIDMVSGGTVTLAGSDGNVQIRGMVATITDNRTGAPTLGQNAAINITKINTECDTALTDYDPPTNAEMVARTLASADYATATALTTIDDFLDTEIAAILADTNELQTDWTDGGRLDLLVDAILDDTGTTGVVVASGSKTGYSLTATTGLGNQTADITGTITTTTNVTNGVNATQIAGSTTAATKLKDAALTIATGTCSGVPTTTNIPTSSISPAATATDQFKGLILKFKEDTTTAALRGQGSDITASTSGGVLTVTALSTAPVSGDTFVIQ